MHQQIHRHPKKTPAPPPPPSADYSRTHSYNFDNFLGRPAFALTSYFLFRLHILYECPRLHLDKEKSVEIYLGFTCLVNHHMCTIFKMRDLMADELRGLYVYSYLKGKYVRNVWSRGRSVNAREASSATWNFFIWQLQYLDLLIWLLANFDM